MSNRRSSKSKVGYKSPPVQTRFKPGQSGNSAGRPKRKVSTFIDAFEKELTKQIKVTEGDKVLMLTKLQAIVIQSVNKAIKGDSKATTLIMTLLNSQKTAENPNLSPIIDALRGIHAQHEIISSPNSVIRPGDESAASNPDEEAEGNDDA